MPKNPQPFQAAQKEIARTCGLSFEMGFAGAAFQKRCILVCSLLWLHVHTPSCGFGRAKQQPLSELRERTGLAIRKSARGRNDGTVLSKEEKKLVSKIAAASEDRNWPAARSLFSGYVGNASPVYGVAMNAAFRCRQYKDGAKIYEQCRTNCELVDQPAFTVALRIFAKLKDATQVQQIWDDALKAYPWDEILGSARIAAAADFGDVEMAAETLDTMNNSNVSINVYHINSAMRACWGWGDKQHKAAKYFFDLLSNFTLSPTIVSFTSLIGAFKTASLWRIVSAYDEMKDLKIPPDAVFAETYIFSLLQTGKRAHMRVEENLHEASIDRLRAAREALNDFKSAGVKMHKVCTDLDKALTRMGIL